MDNARRLGTPPLVGRGDVRALDMDEFRGRLSELVEQAASGAVHIVEAPSGKQAVLISYELYASGDDLRSFLLRDGSGPDGEDPTDIGQ